MMSEIFLSLLGDAGQYAYYETSSPAVTGAQVTLTTKVYRTAYCMSFWYHMYGNTMGTLEVKIGGRTLFTKTGDQGNNWINEKIDVSNNGNSYQVSLTLLGESFSGESLSGKSDEFLEN